MKDVRAKESLLEELRKQLRDADKTKGRMEEKVKAAEEQCRQAKEEASEVYAVKEKLREANVARQSLEKKVCMWVLGSWMGGDAMGNESMGGGEKEVA